MHCNCSLSSSGDVHKTQLGRLGFVSVWHSIVILLGSWYEWTTHTMALFLLSEVLYIQRRGLGESSHSSGAVHGVV
jgi:hypothetical protein